MGKNLVRIIVGDKRADNRRLGEIGVEVGLTESVKKLVRGTWTAHIERMEMENWQREQMPIQWKGNKDEEDYCDRGLHKSGEKGQQI